MSFEGFAKNQLEEIKLGKEEGLDTSVYAKPEYTSIHMHEIRKGLEEKLPVERYLNPEYDWLQMKEIRKGLEEKVNIDLYASPEIPYEKMKLIREALTEGIDLSKYKKLNAGIIKQLFTAIKKNIDISRYVKEGYDAEQLEVIIKAIEKKINIDPYLNKEFRGIALNEILEGLETGMDVSIYADPKYKWQQMRQIRLGLENHLDVSLYKSNLYDEHQMEEIRLGLEEGLDVSKYAKLMYSINDMKRIRAKLQKEFVYELENKTLKSLLETDITVVVIDSRMEAYIICENEDYELTKDGIMDALKRKGVTRGIMEEAINDIVEGRVSFEKPVLVAKGREPKDGNDGYYEFFFRTEIAKTPKMFDDGSVDFQDVEWFETVRENQRVALYHRAQIGMPGFTVMGQIIPARRGKELPMLRGSGFKLLEDGITYVSTMDGRIEISGNYLIISDLFIFDEITLATGNVNVRGNVLIKGNVGTKTSIKATGDIVIEGFVEGANIESDANIFLKKGVNASGQGLLQAGQSVVGMFFESVTVKAKGSILANYIMDSELYTEDMVKLSGMKGLLIGGATYATKGISAYNIGNQSSTKTYIYFGSSKEQLAALNKIENTIVEVENELKIFQNAYNEYYNIYPAEMRNTMEIFKKLDNAIYTKELEMKELKKQLEELEPLIEQAKSAQVVVKGVLYGGVTFESNGVKWNSQEVRNVTVRKTGNKIALYSNGVM